MTDEKKPETGEVIELPHNYEMAGAKLSETVFIAAVDLAAAGFVPASSLAAAEARVAELEKELSNVCDVLYNTGATRGDALTRAKRAVQSYHDHINEQVELEEKLASERAGREQEVAALKKLVAIHDEERASIESDDQIYRCKHVKTPGDGGVVDGCGWQGRRVMKCPGCGSNRFRIVETPTPAPPSEGPTCGYYPDGDGHEIIGEKCGKPATRLSCTPNIDTPTCEAHKCRCWPAKPLPAPSEGPASPVAEASSSCPVCGRDTPHAHSQNDISAWLTGLVARWHYEAEAFVPSERNAHLASSWERGRVAGHEECTPTLHPASNGAVVRNPYGASPVVEGETVIATRAVELARAQRDELNDWREWGMKLCPPPVTCDADMREYIGNKTESTGWFEQQYARSQRKLFAARDGWDKALDRLRAQAAEREALNAVAEWAKSQLSVELSGRLRNIVESRGASWGEPLNPPSAYQRNPVDVAVQALHVAALRSQSTPTGEAKDVVAEFIAERTEQLSRAYDSPLTQEANGYPPVAPAAEGERCPSCPHARHTGICTARNGGTAYACACATTSFPSSWTVDEPPPVSPPAINFTEPNHYPVPPDGPPPIVSIQTTVRVIEPASDADGEKPWTPSPGDRIRNYLSPTDLGTVQTCEPAFSQFGVPVIWDKSPGSLFYVSIAQLVRVEPQSPPPADDVLTGSPSLKEP